MDLFQEEFIENFGEWIIEDIETIEDWLEKEIEVVPRIDMKDDRASKKHREIKLGLRAEPTHKKFRPILRKRLVHEALHLKGLNHGKEAREMNYYSNISRDKHTEKVMNEKLGWKPPSEELYKEYHSKKKELRRKGREKRKNEANYIVYCPRCSKEWYRKKKSSLVKHPFHYHCDECGAELKSKTADGREIVSRKTETVYEYGCPKCDWWKVVHRKTKTIKNIDNYYCAKCGGDLTVKSSFLDKADGKTKTITEFV